MIDPGDSVTIKKIDTAEDPEVPTPPWPEHESGAANPGQSLPLEYQAKGTLMKLETGCPIVAWRRSRNGKERPGLLETSPVESIDAGEDYIIARTQNSIYQIVL